MTLTNESGYLNVNDAHLRVEGNVHASNLLLGNIKINPAYGLNAVTTTSNLTSNTVRFTNATTAFTTTGNVEVGKNLTVTGDSTISGNATVSGNATISGNVFFTSNVTTSVDSNVVVEHKGPHRRDPKDVPLKKYPEIVFAEGKFDANESTNTYVQAGYTVSVSGFVNSSNHPWKAFNGIDFEVGMLLSGLNYDTNGNANTSGTTASRLSASDSTPYGEWLKLELPNKIKLDRYAFTSRNDTTQAIWSQSVEAGQVWGSNNDSDWEHLHTFTDSGFTAGSQTASFDVQTNNYYKYYAFIVTKTFAAGTDYYLCLPELKYYGYEEDPPAGDSSLDATFTSILNRPQTTGANVYVDAKLSSDFTNQVTGPTPVGTAATHNDTGKYWELTGALTSNVTLEANTFLEGDQPHAVSVWFNSSNLEANTANTCVFSVSDQEHLNSQNLDLQSNTWHNLTYAYQGEGGSRVTYLDGRKVSEDQAEDTFGEYPPFAMTGYSQGGYVVSASSEYGSAYLAHEAFNGTFAVNGDAWLSGNLSNYNGGSGQYSGSANLGSDSGGPAFADADKGEWLKLEMPHKFVLDYITICGSTSLTVNPKNWKIYGSNDDKNWDVLLSKTNSVTVAYNATSGKEHVVGATKAYKYFALVVTATNGFVTYTQVAELEFYGHHENDLVRLPDPTNVLKYPHIIINEPSKRGYVISSSSQLVPPNSTGSYQAYNIFDGDLVFDGGNTNNPPNGTAWITGGSKYDGSGNPTGTAATTNVTGQNPLSTPGEYFQLELPHKVKLSSIRVMGTTENTTNLASRSPVNAVLAGSNDGTTWTTVLTYTNASWTTLSEFKSFPANVDSTNAYKYFRFIITKNGGNDKASLQAFEFYGTEEASSIPIQIGGGNIDKVANFRVYDKFVGEDQALEIWDAQKDEFGRAKSSMTLHKGRLGIGTTEPEGRLAVADEPHYPILEEFPPKPLAGYKTHIEGHGEFCVKVSSNNTDNYAGWKAFNKIFTGGEGWMSEDNPDTYTQGTGLPNSTTAVFNGKQGEWLHIELPYKIRLKKTTILQRTSSDHPRPTGSFTIWGSNDTVNWDEIITGTHTRTVADNETTGDPINRDIDTSKFYSSYVFQVHSIIVTGGNEDTCHVAEWKLFGTREQGQSVLHDGQLTLTKNLNVPRIGPPLDADDTPRRDRLVVEYNTSTNPTFEGAVRDTSGRGNDAVLLDGAYYDATEKALDISAYNGSAPAGSQTAHIKSGILPGFTGNQAHTMSFWFKGGSDINGTFATLAPQSAESNYQVSSIHYQVTNNRFKLEGWGNDFYVNVTLYTGTLYHVALTYEGSTVTTITKKLYINGVQQTNTTSHTEGSAANFTNTIVCLGERSGGGDEVNGQISNFKLYDCALTASEVKTLYDMGRCDEGHHVVNFSKTRVGIGLGDGEAPTYTLDVRGQIRSQGSLVTSFTGQHRCFPDEPVEKGLIVSAKKNRFVKLNGFATGQEAITIDESLPIVSLSNVAEDKACFGVVSSIEKPTPKRIQVTNGIISDSKKERGDNRAIVNSVGEGAIWIVNTGGPLESGDYITTSSVKGYGQYQSSQYLTNFTVAKITMDCDFNPAIQPVLRIKKDDDGMNILDEHGQLQWEEHPTETERAYKIRYLDANGTETDEVNAVHIAAFVGCTYHCG